MSVQSVVTPSTNGVAKPKRSTKAFKDKALSTTKPFAGSEPMTLEKACDICFKAGDGFASIQDSLSAALVAFKGNETAREAMRLNMVLGYAVKKLGYTKEHATKRFALKKHNKDKTYNPDTHRSFEEERIVTAVNVMWLRANILAGTNPPKTAEAIARAEKTKATADSNKAAKQEAWDIVHPKPETDVNEAMVRLVSTMKAYMSKHSAKFVGNSGMAWRDWLDVAPISKMPRKA